MPFNHEAFTPGALPREGILFRLHSSFIWARGPGWVITQTLTVVDGGGGSKESQGFLSPARFASSEATDSSSSPSSLSIFSLAHFPSAQGKFYTLLILLSLPCPLSHAHIFLPFPLTPRRQAEAREPVLFVLLTSCLSPRHQ